MKNIKRRYHKTVSIVNETPTEMYQNLVGSGIGFLLESYDKNYDRFSILGRDPAAIIRSDTDGLLILGRDGRVTKHTGNPQKLLKEYYDSFQIDNMAESDSFNGGLVGSIGYDFIRYTEELPDDNPDDIGIGTIQLMLVTEYLVVDHFSETMSAVVLESPDEEGYARAQEKIGTLLADVRTPADIEEKLFVKDGRMVDSTDDINSYGQKVIKIKDYIRQGHVFQTVVSQRWTAETGQDGFAIYKELRRRNPSPYLYYYNFGSFEIIGSSPEMIVKKQGSRVFTCPIAGTRRRGADADEDRRLADELIADEKERAEHVMLVDLARNDMGRISTFGSVKVTEWMQVHYYSHVMHIVSMVEGKVKEKEHPFDLLSSFLPAGTLSGAPKIRAMEIIDELEEVRRGLYGGATGYLDFSGDMDFCITIRTMIKQGEKIYMQAGAGIVADSVPANEYQECKNKIMALASTLIPEENL